VSCLVHRASVHSADAGQVPAGPHLPAPRQDAPGPPLHAHPDRLLRAHHGRQGNHHHLARVPDHGLRQKFTRHYSNN